MPETIKKYTKKVGIPRILITGTFFALFITAFLVDLPISILMSNVIRRFGMFGVLVLAMVPSIRCGIGPNFALPLGIVTGILGGLLSIELGLNSFWGALMFAIPFGIVVGYFYGVLLNKIKGSEMLVATYTGFSAVSFMSIMWILLPFDHKEMVWPIGKGLRVTISLEKTFGNVLNNWLGFKIGGVYIPTGLLLFFFGMCFIVWIFSKSKHGVAMKASGDNPGFALASGMNVDAYRILGTVLSTVLGSIGILVYAQSYNFIQLYNAPLRMAFPAVAGVLIGGATASKAKISHAIIGVFLFQGLLTIALPVASELVPQGNVAEALRMIVQNGIILYALTKVGGK